MIGDWVIYRDTPKKVVYIYCRPLPDGSNPANEIGFTHDEEEWINADHASPIPLTAEILEKNGYKSHSNRFALLESKYWTFKNDKGVCIELKESKNAIAVWLDYDKNVQGIYAAFPSYVHELQHALRLCGLNDMADNFKV